MECTLYLGAQTILILGCLFFRLKLCITHIHAKLVLSLLPLATVNYPLVSRHTEARTVVVHITAMINATLILITIYGSCLITAAARFNNGLPRRHRYQLNAVVCSKSVYAAFVAYEIANVSV